MNTALWQKLDQAARNITPFLLTLVLVFISVLPTRIPIYAEVAPVLALVAVYHWAIYRPNLMPLWCVFLLGLALIYARHRYIRSHDVTLSGLGGL